MTAVPRADRVSIATRHGWNDPVAGSRDVPPAAVTPGIAASRRARSSWKSGAPRVAVADVRQVHVERQHAIDAEAEVHLHQTVEAHRQHAGADEKRQRERELRGGEAAFCSRPCRREPVADRDCSHERPVGSLCARPQRRGHSERQGRRDRHDRGEHQHGRVEADLVDSWERVAAERLEDVHAERREHEAGQAAEVPPGPGFRPAAAGRAGRGRSRARHEPRTRARVRSRGRA